MPRSGSVKKISSIWNDLTGSSAEFSLEARVFHSICLGLMLLLLVYAPYNFFEGLIVGAISALLIALFFCYQYYHSRFRGRRHNSTLFAITGLVFFVINYFSNAGIDGSTDLIWPSYLLLVLAISPYWQHVAWILAYVAIFFAIHVLEYLHPELVLHPFDMGTGKFIDRITAFPLPVVGTAIIIIFLRRSYDKERAVAEEKTVTISMQNEQLEQRNAEKNKLLSIISHDLRAPFSHLKGYLELLKHIKMGDAERKDMEGKLLLETGQMIEMLTGLLDWSRSQMQGVSANLVATHLLEAVRKTLELEKTIAAKKKIELSYDIDAAIVVTADVHMLQLVVRNIVSNAVKFTHEGGRVHVRAQASANSCSLIVADNGTGIEPEKIPLLFSIAAGSTPGTKNERGVGLGLSLCKEFMELQEGHIHVESTLGEGTTFYIAIPSGAGS